MLISRKTYIVTAAVFFAGSIAALYFVVFLGGCIFLPMYSKSFIVARWLNLTIICCACALAVASVSFFFSSVFAANKWGFTLMIAIPVLFMLLVMIGGTSAELLFLTKLSPYGWFEYEKIARGVFDTWWVYDIIFVGIIAALFTAALYIFKRKQLSI